MNANRDYYLLLIDIRDSTEIPPKSLETSMARLRAQLTRLNRRLRADLELGLRISYGDEVAGLFLSRDRIFEAVTSVRDALYPEAHIRFVVAKGRIGVVSRDIRKIGGPVFKMADETMDQLKRQRRFAAWRLGDTLLDGVLDALTETSNALVEQMTGNQREVFALVKRDFKRMQIASKLGKSKQSVSSAAVRGNVDVVAEAERVIGDVLADLSQKKTSAPRKST